MISWLCFRELPHDVSVCSVACPVETPASVIIMSVKNSTTLPPLAPGTKKSAATPTLNNSAGGDNSTRGSLRPSSRGGAGGAQSTAATAGGDNISVRSERSGRSQGAVASERSAGAGSNAQAGGSVRTSSQAGAGSTRSISSSQALEKLQQLEQVLNQERHAREEAETTLLALSKERQAKDAALQQSQMAQKQLGEVMSALQKILADPNDGAAIRRLQGVVRSTGVSGTNSNSKSGRPAAVEENATFLDGIGQYERDRQQLRREMRTGKK